MTPVKFVATRENQMAAVYFDPRQASFFLERLGDTQFLERGV